MELTTSLQHDQVRHLKPKDPISVAENLSIRDAVDVMQRQGEGCVIVCDSRGKATGIFTERDLLRRVIGECQSLDLPIKDVMSSNLATVRLSDPIMQAITTLNQRGLRHLPVLSEQGQPLGVVSVRRVMEYLVEHTPRAVYNQPPESSKPLGTREGA